MKNRRGDVEAQEEEYSSPIVFSFYISSFSSSSSTPECFPNVFL
jgi:hypothetical protein